MRVVEAHSGRPMFILSERPRAMCLAPKLAGRLTISSITLLVLAGPVVVGAQESTADVQTPPAVRSGERESGERESGDVAQTQADLEARIQELIQQLGSSQYATRQRAKTELKRLRLEAFDALNEATTHDDIEIALSARYLVRSMQVNWWTDEDTPEVKRLLRGYGGRQEEERRNLMEQLARLGRDASFRPLCRLVRYEASERLSKRAALLMLGLELPPAESERKQFASDLLALAGKSKRTAADWLRGYAELLVDAPGCRQHWAQLIAKEQAQLAENPDETSRGLTRELLNWYADQLSLMGQREESLAIMRETIELLSAKEQELVEAADWFRQRESWPIIVELAERFPDTFQRSPMLQYRLAFAYRALNDESKANEAAKIALENVEVEPQYHLEMAENLQQDGLFEWAELEYRHVVAAMDEEPAEAVRAALYLSELLHDLGRESAAGEVLKSLVETIEAKDEVRKVVEESLGRDVDGITSRMFYFLAQHEAQQKNFEKQRELLLEGYSNDERDADVLIAMYRAEEADDQWRQETRERIKKAADSYRKQLKEFDERLNSARSFEERAFSKFQLALTNNQLAWLVSNTEGDFDESLRCSQKSLELQPGNAGFLDTLGRCYYAKGDFENAVKCQSQAVAKEPHSPLMIRQLELFQEALRKQQAESEEAAAPDGQPQAD